MSAAPQSFEAVAECVQWDSEAVPGLLRGLAHKLGGRAVAAALEDVVPGCTYRRPRDLVEAVERHVARHNHGDTVAGPPEHVPDPPVERPTREAVDAALESARAAIRARRERSARREAA